MAEVIGITAAAVQLTATALELKRMYSEIKDGPIDILELIEDIDALAKVLTNTQRLDMRQSVDDEVWTNCYQPLKLSVDEINRIVGDLNAIVKTHKRTGAIRVFFKREQIKKYRAKLERVKTSIIAAQGVYTHTFALDSYQMLKDLHRLFTTQSKSEQQTSVSTTTASSVSSVTSTTLAIDAGDQKSWTTSKDIISKTTQVCVETRLGHRQKQRRLRSTFEFRLPPTVLSNGLQLFVERGNATWGVTLRKYGYIHLSLELDRCIDAGQWDDVHQLIHSGRASPYDMDEFGNTLLHIAASNANYQVCKLLLDFGLSLSTRSRINHTAFDALQHYFLVMELHLRYRCERHDRFEATLMLFLSTYSNGFTGQDLSDLMHVIGIFPPGAISYIISRVHPSYEALDPQFRAVIAMFCGWNDPLAIYQLLGDDQTFVEALERLKDFPYYYRILQSKAAIHLGLNSNKMYPYPWYGYTWVEILVDIFRFESGNMSLSCDHSTLESHLYGCQIAYASWSPELRLDDQTYTKEVRAWVQLLERLKIDLVQYGRAESAYHADENAVSFAYFHKSPTTANIRYRIRYLTYGPKAEDWNVFLIPIGPVVPGWQTPGSVEDLYALAGQFWELIECPELFHVPGTYFD